MKVRTAFIFDVMSETEQEVESAIWELEELFPGHEFETVVVGETVQSLDGHRFDLIILDYGGISIGAYDTAAFNMRQVCKYAEDHPSCLLVIWTQYTMFIYQDELEEQFGLLKNIIYRYNDIYSTGDSHFVETISLWFPETGELKETDNEAHELVAPRTRRKKE